MEGQFSLFPSSDTTMERESLSSCDPSQLDLLSCMQDIGTTSVSLNYNDCMSNSSTASTASSAIPIPSIGRLRHSRYPSTQTSLTSTSPTPNFFNLASSSWQSENPLPVVGLPQYTPNIGDIAAAWWPQTSSSIPHLQTPYQPACLAPMHPETLIPFPNNQSNPLMMDFLSAFDMPSATTVDPLFSHAPTSESPRSSASPEPQPPLRTASRSRSIHRSSRSPPRCRSRSRKTTKAAADGMSFVNFTPEDSQTILSGVAPSGSSKTKARRDQEAREKRRKIGEAALYALKQVGGDVQALEGTLC